MSGVLGVIVLEVYCLAFSMLTGHRIKFQLLKCINQVPTRFSSKINNNSAQVVRSQTAYMDAGKKYHKMARTILPDYQHLGFQMKINKSDSTRVCIIYLRGVV
jgi:hypothetical protein